MLFSSLLLPKLKMVSFDHQLHKLGIAIACFQEGRARKAGVFLSDHYVRCVSEAFNGNYGCQIWLSVVVPLGVVKGVDVRVKFDDVSVVLSLPRLLIAIVTTKITTFAVVSAHAPHQTCDDLVEWWDEFPILVRTYTRGLPTILGIDTNARSPEVGDEFIGAFGFTEQHKTTELMAKALRSLKCWLPATFSEYCNTTRQQDSYYYDPAKPPIRIDYLGFIGDFEVSLDSFGVPNMVLHSKRKDHLPVGGSARFPPLGRCGVKRRRVAQYDRAGVKDPCKVAVFNKMLCSLPPLPAALEPSSHVHILNSAVKDAAIKAFPIPMRVKRRDYLSDVTFSVLSQKLEIAASTRWHGRRIKFACVRFVIWFWRGWTWKSVYDPVRGFACKESCMARAWAPASLVALDNLFHFRAEADWAIHVELQADKLNNELLSIDSKISSELLGRSRPDLLGLLSDSSDPTAVLPNLSLQSSALSNNTSLLCCLAMRAPLQT